MGYCDLSGFVVLLSVDAGLFLRVMRKEVANDQTRAVGVSAIGTSKQEVCIKKKLQKRTLYVHHI